MTRMKEWSMSEKLPNGTFSVSGPIDAFWMYAPQAEQLTEEETRTVETRCEVAMARVLNADYVNSAVGEYYFSVVVEDDPDAPPGRSSMELGILAQQKLRDEMSARDDLALELEEAVIDEINAFDAERKESKKLAAPAIRVPLNGGDVAS